MRQRECNYDSTLSSFFIMFFVFKRLLNEGHDTVEWRYSFFCVQIER